MMSQGSNNSGATYDWTGDCRNAAKYTLLDETFGNEIFLHRDDDNLSGARQVSDEIYFEEGNIKYPVITVIEVDEQGNPQGSPILLFTFRGHGDKLLVYGSALTDRLEPKLLRTGGFNVGNYDAIAEIIGVKGQMAFALDGGVIKFNVPVPGEKLNGYTYITNAVPSVHASASAKNDSEIPLNPITRDSNGILHNGSYIQVSCSDTDMPRYELHVCYPGVSFVFVFLFVPHLLRLNQH